jgi:broad specificity phosphatase PhoE
MGTLVLIRHGQASYGEADYDRLSSRGEEQARALGRFLERQRIDQVFAGPLRRQQGTIQLAREAAPSLPEPKTLVELAEYPAFDLLQHFMPKLVTEDAKFGQLTQTPTRELAPPAGRAKGAPPARSELRMRPEAAGAAGDERAKRASVANEAFHTILGKWARDEWRVTGVEDVTAFAHRVRRGLDQIVRETASGARVAVVTSAGPIGVAVGLTFGATPHHMVRTSTVIRNASISELKFRSREFDWHPERVSLLTFNSTHHLPPELHTEY